MMKTAEKPRPSSLRSYGICGHASPCGQVAAGPRWLSEDFLLTGEMHRLRLTAADFLCVGGLKFSSLLAYCGRRG